MKLISGTARNVRSTAETLSLDLDGQDVRLHKPGGKGLVEDGDDLIVAGPQEGGALVGYAYRNVTRGHGDRAALWEDSKRLVLSVLFFALGCWPAFSPPSDDQVLFYSQRIGGYGFVILWGLVAGDAALTIARKILAGFRVNRAGIETVRGTARNVRLSEDRCAAHFDVDARQVKLAGMPRKIVIGDGDEVAVAGRRAGGVLLGMDYSNVTRRVAGRRWMAFGVLGRVLWIGVVAFGAAGLWSQADPAFIITLLRRALALAFMTGVLIYAVDQYFRWRLDLTAWWRIRAPR
jgi:hypothetical protein